MCACTTQDSGDQLFYGQSTHGPELSHNEVELCDEKLARLMIYLQCTSDYRQHCHVGNKASECKLWFKPRPRCGDSTDSTSTFGGMLGLLGDHTCVPISRTCKMGRVACVNVVAYCDWRVKP